MRARPTKALEKHRVRTGMFKSDRSYGNNGKFEILGPYKNILTVVISDGMGWDHVSVSLPNRTPRWGEMCFIKDLFFEEEEVVIQFHPPKSKYIDNHPHCLHMWKPHKFTIPMPPTSMVGI